MKMTEEEYRTDYVAITKEEVDHLIKRKDELEEQIKTYYEVLENQGNVGMYEPLVDVEGYPRTDVDLFQIRTARQSILCLQNDHKVIMEEIEEAICQLHAQERAQHEQDQAEAQIERMEQDVSLPPPFARVDTVTQGSPAHQAGLCVGDEIIEFGSVNPSNFHNLQNIASVVQHSEGKSVSVAVIRNGQKVQLSLTPQCWSGRGLLGCRIVLRH